MSETPETPAAPSAASGSKSKSKDTSVRSGSRNARRRAREFAIQGIYEWIVSQSDGGVIEANLRGSPGFDLCDRAHLTALLYGVIKTYTELNAALLPYLDRQPEHISPVERAVLLMATYELHHHPEIPYRVVINEAIDLTKVFGGTDGFKFVNGILDRVAIDCGVREGRR